MTNIHDSTDSLNAPATSLALHSNYQPNTTVGSRRGVRGLIEAVGAHQPVFTVNNTCSYYFFKAHARTRSSRPSEATNSHTSTTATNANIAYRTPLACSNNPGEKRGNSNKQQYRILQSTTSHRPAHSSQTGREMYLVFSLSGRLFINLT
jgi:hypothetical protein